MNRRQFIATTATSSAGYALGAKPTAKTNSLTLGFSLYGMKTLKTGEALRRLSSIGYDSVEFCLNDGWDAAPKNLTPKRRKALRTLLEEVELKMTALMININLHGDQKANQAKIQKAAEIGHALSPKTPPIIETVGGGGNWEAVKNQFRDNLGHWAEAAKASKTIVCLKPHRGGAVNRPEDAVWLAQQINSPWLKLAYDYSHFAHRDISLEGSLKQMIPHTRFIHVKDTIIKDGRPRFVIPGASGQINYRKLIGTAFRLGYRGDINAEISGQVWGQKDYDPIATAIACYRNLSPSFILEQ